METIRDRHGHILGFLDDKALANGIVARNREGHVVAVYDVLSNTTRLPNGHLVGYGNTVAAYLVPGR